MKLYYSKGSCSLATHIIANEVNAQLELEAVNLSTKQTATGKDFFTINPKGSVPALLTDDNQLLTENVVIQQYLADTHNAHHLLPPVGDFRRYRVLEWLNFITTELHKGCSPLFNANVPQDIKDTVFKPRLKTRFQYVEQSLEKSQYLLGDQFTLPDGYLFVVLSWMPHFKMDMAAWPRLSAYFAALSQRDSVKKAIEKEKAMEKES